MVIGILIAIWGFHALFQLSHHYEIAAAQTNVQNSESTLRVATKDYELSSGSDQRNPLMNHENIQK